MVEKVSKNRRSLLNMSKDRKDFVCAICLDEIKADDKATLDSCIHSYCFNCIKSWVIDCENPGEG